MMPAAATAVIVAAALHASWNASAHRIKDRAVGFALISISCAFLGLMLILLAPLPAAAAWPFVLTSAAMHVVYMVLLIRSYELGDFNQMYPLARGTSPLVVAVVAVTIVGQPLRPWQAVGVVVISAGLAVLVFGGGSSPTHAARPAILAAVVTGFSIATYTVLDGVGVRHAHSTLGYIGWLFFLQGLWIPAFLAVRRGRQLVADCRPVAVEGLAAGVVSVLAYGLVIWAQTRSNLASVAALRELSILFGALIGLVFFHEWFGRARVVGAAITVAGVVLINL